MIYTICKIWYTLLYCIVTAHSISSEVVLICGLNFAVCIDGTFNVPEKDQVKHCEASNSSTYNKCNLHKDSTIFFQCIRIISGWFKPYHHPVMIQIFQLRKRMMPLWQWNESFCHQLICARPLVGEACKAWRSKLQSSKNPAAKQGAFFHSEGQFFSKIAINLKSPRWSIEALGVLPVLSARRWRLCCIHGWQRQRVVLARNPFVRRVAILQADTCRHYTIDTFF